MRWVDDPTLLRGLGRFDDDLPTPPHARHAAFLRSPLAHGEIRAIDTPGGIDLNCPVQDDELNDFAWSLSPLRDEEPHADEVRIRDVLSSHSCRCTGYHGIVQAALEAFGKG